MSLPRRRFEVHTKARLTTMSVLVTKWICSWKVMVAKSTSVAFTPGSAFMRFINSFSFVTWRPMNLCSTNCRYGFREMNVMSITSSGCCSWGAFGGERSW